MPEDENPAPRPDHGTDSGSGGSRWRSLGGVLIPAVTFLVGLALGVVVAMQSDSGDEEPGAQPASPTASATSGAESGDTVVIVPSACQDAAQNISEATRLLDEAAGSLRDFSPQELVDLLDRLETLDRETRALAKDCSDVSVSQEPGSTDSASPSDASESPEDSESP